MESSATNKLLYGNGAEEAGATIEIKIKTLDSQTHTLRVDKEVPVPALKDQIASVTGVLSEQQRLICRGKVLKDDQLLSAYHVEDGHTLHLVARQPDLASSGLPHHQASDPNSSGSHGHHSQSAPGVVIETFNMPVRGDRVTPDISRIFSAVIGSIGISNIIGGTEGIGVRENDPHTLDRTTGLSGISEASHPHPDQVGVQGLTESLRGIFEFPTAVSLGSHPQVIPDSLTTMSLYLSHMGSQFDAILRDPASNVQSAEIRQAEERSANTSSPSTRNQVFLSPASLAEVLLSTRNMFIGQAGECVIQLARQLESQANIDDPLMRSTIQANALRTGGQLYNLGAFLLELGRTTMALRLGQTPSEAVVNSGPAVFISSSSPNPIMVQPLPFQSTSSLGSVPMGAAPSVSGFLPRRIDLQIRRGSSTSPDNVNREDRGDRQHSTAQRNLGENSVNQAASRDAEATSLPGESGVRVVPIRTVVASVPGSFGFPSESLGSLPTPNTREEMPNARTVSINVLTSGGAQRNQTEQQMPSHVLQFLRSAFPGDDMHMEGSSLRGTIPNSEEAGIGRGSAQVPAAEANVSDDGVFLSNLLREIMPVISQHTGAEANASLQGPNASSEHLTRESANHAGTNAGTTRGHDDNESSSPSSKRQKTE